MIHFLYLGAPAEGQVKRPTARKSTTSAAKKNDPKTSKPDPNRVRWESKGKVAPIEVECAEGICLFCISIDTSFGSPDCSFSGWRQFLKSFLSRKFILLLQTHKFIINSCLFQLKTRFSF